MPINYSHGDYRRRGRDFERRDGFGVCKESSHFGRVWKYFLDFLKPTHVLSEL